MAPQLDPYEEFGPADEDFSWMDDSTKLRLLADWFDLQDRARNAGIPNPDSDIQADLRRIADELEEDDYQESVFWIATVMVLIVVLIIVVLF